MVAYLKKDIPERLHYKNNNRIQPILLIADEGWTIIQRGNKIHKCKYPPARSLCYRSAKTPANERPHFKTSFFSGRPWLRQLATQHASLHGGVRAQFPSKL